MASDWKNAFDVSGLADSLNSLRANAARAGAMNFGSGGGGVAPKQSPEDDALADKISDIMGGGQPAFAGSDAAGGVSQRAAPPPAAQPKPAGGVAKRTSVPGIFAIQGPDGSTTFTDVPGGTFEQSGAGGSPDMRRTPGGRLVGEMGTGDGNFSAAGATSGGGLRYKLPSGGGVPDEGTRQGFQPGSTAWLNANANVTQGKDESDADFGNRLAASKAAGVNYRTHAGQFALPAVSLDPSVVGPDAAYGRNGGAPASGGGGGGGSIPGLPGMPPGVNLEGAKVLSGISNQNTETGIAVAKNTAEQEKAARDFDQSKYDEHYKALEGSGLSGEDRMRAAAARTHNDMVQKFPGVESSAFTNSNLGRQVLADEMAARTASRGEVPTRGKADLGEFAVEKPGYWTRNGIGGLYNPLDWIGANNPNHPAEIARGLSFKDDGSYTPNPDAQRSAGTMFTNQTPVGRVLFGENGEKAGDFSPALDQAHRLRAARLQIAKRQANQK